MNAIEEGKRLESEFEKSRNYWIDLGWFKVIHYEWKREAYQDQYGIWHEAHVIDDEKEIHVVDTFIYVDYGQTMLGLIAEDVDGNKYQRRPSAIDMCTDYWSGNGHYDWHARPFMLTIYSDGRKFEDK